MRTVANAAIEHLPGERAEVAGLDVQPCPDARAFRRKAAIRLDGQLAPSVASTSGTLID